MSVHNTHIVAKQYVVRSL